MNIPDDDIDAYVDGALPADAARRIDAAVAGDVMVAARVERARRLRAQVRGSGGHGGTEPHRAVEDAQARRQARQWGDDDEAEPSTPRGRWRRPLLIVAAAVVAVAASTWMRPGEPLGMRDGLLVARGALARDLDTLESGVRGRSTYIALSFRDDGGRVCRVFVDPADSLRGLACRENDRWALPMLLSARPGDLAEGDARALPADLGSAVRIRMRGPPLDADAERDARAAGWR